MRPVPNCPSNRPVLRSQAKLGEVGGHAWLADTKLLLRAVPSESVKVIELGSVVVMSATRV